MRQRGMSIQLQPNLHAEVRQRASRERKPYWLANAACPIGGIARFAGTAVARHCAEKWSFARLWFEIGQRSFQGLRRRSHERMMERMINPNESRKRALRLELGRHRLQRNARTRERDRTRSVEGGNCYGAVVPGDQ